MSSPFPTSLPSYPGFISSHTLQQDSHAAQHNQEQADITAIATAHGVNGATQPTQDTVLRGTSTDGDSDWQKLNLTTDVTGVLAVAHGGTGGSSLTTLVQLVYPVGSIYAETTGVNPQTTFGFGTWTATGQGRVLVGAGTSDQAFAAGVTGGESNHTLSTAEMPAHTHGIYDNTAAGVSAGAATAYVTNLNLGGVQSTSTGGGGSHNNLPPYQVIFYWTRTA